MTLDAVPTMLRWARRPAFGLRGVSTAAGLLTAAVSAEAVDSVARHDGGLLAALAVPLMIAPAAFARRWLVPSAVAVAAGTALNVAVAPHVVRCGTGLPVAFYLAYLLGRTAIGRARFAAAAAVAASIAIQCVYDPRLGTSVMGLMLPVAAVFAIAGSYVRSRAELVAELRRRTAELSLHREESARVAVAAARLQIGADLKVTLGERIDLISAALADAHANPVEPQQTFAVIEKLGRQTLDATRAVLGALHDTRREPEPGLAELPELVRRSAFDVRLVVDGAIRPLPASIELSTYRIVEYLLPLLGDDPRARISVRIGDDQLELALAGPPADRVDPNPPLSIARTRAALHGGTIEVVERPEWRDTHVSLPLVSSHA